MLALIQEKECVAAEILREFGAQYEKAKEFVREFSPAEGQNEFAPLSPHLARIQRLRSAIDPRTVRIHNTEHDVEFVRAGVIFCRGMLWHWAKKTWRPQDIVVCRSDGRISFDLSLAEDTANFQLVQNGWNHDVCKICNWRLYVTPETEHSTGYTNGKIWVCVECYEKFVSGADYFATAYPEIT